VCALDAEGPLCAYVENGATGARYTAVRGEGARLDGEVLTASDVAAVDRAVVAIVAMPPYEPPWRQFRSLGSAALALCDVGAGSLDGFLDCTNDMHCPWDYLGGLLVCRESGAHVADVRGRELVVADPAVRRQPVAAGTRELLTALRAVFTS
jgi:fructose-1,6-bisphosphatase/inositol monophosphatase family enzyme